MAGKTKKYVGVQTTITFQLSKTVEAESLEKGLESGRGLTVADFINWTLKPDVTVYDYESEVTGVFKA